MVYEEAKTKEKLIEKLQYKCLVFMLTSMKVAKPLQYECSELKYSCLFQLRAIFVTLNVSPAFSIWSSQMPTTKRFGESANH